MLMHDNVYMKRIRQRHPKGQRVMLIEMDDKQAPPVGRARH